MDKSKTFWWIWKSIRTLILDLWRDHPKQDLPLPALSSTSCISSCWSWFISSIYSNHFKTIRSNITFFLTPTLHLNSCILTLSSLINSAPIAPIHTTPSSHPNLYPWHHTISSLHRRSLVFHPFYFFISTSGFHSSLKQTLKCLNDLTTFLVSISTWGATPSLLTSHHHMPVQILIPTSKVVQLARAM